MNRLGPHCTRPTPGGKAWAAKANCVKALDSPEMFAYAPDSAIRIYRLYLPYQDQTAADLGGAGLADIIIASLGGYNHRNLYLEILNEWKQAIDEIEYHADIVEAATARAHARGYKVAGFSFSTGNPEPEVWQYLKARGFCGVDAIALHEYWASAGFSTWNALRYRRVHDWLGGQHPPFLITECGRDAIGGEGGEGKPGWQKQGISSEQYVSELIAYDAELQRDRYVLGGVVFASGTYSDFAAFEVDSLVDLIPAATQPIPEQPQQEQGGGNVDIALAIFPALQAYNRYVKYGSDEWSATAWQADRMVECARAKGINARVFHRPSDTASSTAQLVAQQDEGHAWLSQQPQSKKAAINIHTDSGDFSHTFGIFAPRTGADSQRLADILSRKVQAVLGTADRRVFSQLGTTDYNEYIFATHAKVPAVLLELCSHQHERDLDALWAAGSGLAMAMVDGVIEWAGQPTCPHCADLRRQLETATATIAERNAAIENYRAYLANIGRLANAGLQKG